MLHSSGVPGHRSFLCLCTVCQRFSCLLRTWTQQPVLYLISYALEEGFSALFLSVFGVVQAIKERGLFEDELRPCWQQGDQPLWTEPQTAEQKHYLLIITLKLFFEYNKILIPKTPALMFCEVNHRAPTAYWVLLALPNNARYSKCSRIVLWPKSCKSYNVPSEKQLYK